MGRNLILVILPGNPLKMNEIGACVLGGGVEGLGVGGFWVGMELITHFLRIPECTAIQHDVLSTGFVYLDYFMEKYDKAWVE